MPWTIWDYPPAMAHLAPAVREKAVHIANALLAEGKDDGSAIRMAIAAARRWAQHHGLDADESGTTGAR